MAQYTVQKYRMGRLCRHPIIYVNKNSVIQVTIFLTSLRGHWWFLRGVLVVFDVPDVLYIHQGSCISSFISLPTWEVFCLIGSPENHSGV